MSNKRLNGRDRYFIRKDGNGVAISGSGQWRKRIPRGQGNWVDITECVVNCCTNTPTQGSYFIVQGASTLDTDTVVTGISYPGFSWTGTIAAGDMMVFALPYGFATTATFTIEVVTAGADFTTSTLVGTGTATADPTSLSTDPDPQTFVVDFTADTSCQYLILIENT